MAAVMTGGASGGSERKIVVLRHVCVRVRGLTLGAARGPGVR
jgi:hypothetical protein